MTEQKIYALCKDPKVDYLTDGKRYEVIYDQPSGRFMIKVDGGNVWWFTWGDTFSATWTRIEESEPPLWALNKVVQPGWNNWQHFLETYNANSPAALFASAHASTLAKYETEPVDPVDQAASEYSKTVANSVGEWNDEKILKAFRAGVNYANDS